MFLQWIIYFAWLSLTSSTDLVAVYKHSVHLLKDVDKVSKHDPPISLESHVLDVPQPFHYPIGLTYDAQGHRLFVAEAVQEDKNGVIFSLELDSDLRVKRMHSVIKTSNKTVIEGLTYNPKSSNLYWTDALNHGIYKAWVPNDPDNEKHSVPEPAYQFGDILKPRGLAIDYCTDRMYWSERNGTGSVTSSIEMCDLHSSSHMIIQKGEDNDKFYQGMTFDILGGKLLWAETVGSQIETTSCKIISYEFGLPKPKQEVLISRDICFPFSLVSDENYIYWADWAQEGIMRASRQNYSEIVKLVHAPQFESTWSHKGVFGLAILDDLTEDNIRNACDGKRVIQEKAHEESKDYLSMDSLPKDSLKTPQTAEHLSKESPITTVLPPKGSPITETTLLKDSAKTVEPSLKASPKTTLYIDRKSLLTSTKDYTIDARLPPQTDSPVTAKNFQSSDIEEDPNFTRENGKGTKVADIDASSHGELIKDPELLHISAEMPQEQGLEGHRCSEDKLVMVIVTLALFSVLMIVTTVVLAIMVWRSRRSKKELPTTVCQEVPTGFKVQPRQPKRFGPKIKPPILNGSTCAGQGDGVKINIEDCCQMTLCDTPCYSTVKKEGKGYRVTARQGNSKTEDNRKLLDDSDDLSIF